MSITVTFSDGSKIEGLTLSGNHLVSEDEGLRDKFAHNLKDVKIESVGEEYVLDAFKLLGEHKALEILDFKKWAKDDDAQYGGKYLLALRSMSDQEIRDEEINSRLDFLEMMVLDDE